MFYKLCYMAQLQEPDPVDNIRRTRAVIVRNTASQLADTTLKSWDYWFKDGVFGKWKATEKTFILRFGDVECEVLFRPLDTPDDISRVLSLEITFAIIDEFVQIPQEIVEGLSGRCGRYPPNPALDADDEDEDAMDRTDGHSGIRKGSFATNWGVWGASNVGTEDSWWYTYLHPQVEDPDAKLPDNVFLVEQPSGLDPLAENLDNLPGGRNYYLDLAVGKSKEWVDRFIHCIWGFSLHGKPVLSCFNPTLHVSRNRLKANPHLPLCIGYDPGMNGAFIIAQNDLHDRALILGEVITSNMGAERAIRERLLPYLRLHFPQFAIRDMVMVPDPAANNRAQSDEQTVVQVVRKYFRCKFDTDNRLPSRIGAVEHFALRRTDVGEALLIDGSMCPMLVRAFSGGWMYKVDSKGRQDPEPDKRNPFSHPADSACYVLRYFQRQQDKQLRTAKARPLIQSRGNTAAMYHTR